jgi:hypothetical protein
MHRLNRFAALLLVAQPTLGWAQEPAPSAPVDPVAAATKARADAAAADLAEANARKAKVEADAAELKAKIPDFGTGDIKGTTTVGAKAGQLEAAMLSAEATGVAASRLVDQICKDLAQCTGPVVRAPAPPALAVVTNDDVCVLIAPPAGTNNLPKLYIYSEAERPNFDVADGVAAQFCAAQRQFEAAMRVSSQVPDSLAKAPAVKIAVVAAVVPALPAISAAISAAASIFKSDFAVDGVDVAPDDLLLAKLVAAQSNARLGWTAVIPALYRPVALVPDSPVVQRRLSLDKQKAAADERVKHHRARAIKLTPAAGDKSPGAKESGALAAKHVAAAETLEAAIKAYDALFTKLATPTDKGVTELSEAARQSVMQADLARGAYLLVLKMNAAGGSHTTKKNFITFFGGIPFQVSGGSVVSYALLDGRDARVVGAGSVAAAGGHQSLGKIHRRFGWNPGQ